MLNRLPLRRPMSMHEPVFQHGPLHDAITAGYLLNIVHDQPETPSTSG